MKIGFFDSGLGGITILNSVRKQLPLYDYLYFGDTKNLPYGDKSEEEIFKLTEQGVRILFDAGASLVIIACNTASAQTLRKLQDTILVGAYAERRLLGVIIPTIEVLIESGARDVLLIGTQRTINSGKYEKELKKLSSTIKLSTYATPSLVPYIEDGDIDGAWNALNEVLAPRVGEIDTLILGCTHYPVLKSRIRETYNLNVISQDEIIPSKLQKYLKKHNEIQTKLSHGKSIQILLSKEDARYTKIKESYL